MTDRYATGIVWFRRDLRLTDQPALNDALDHCDRVVLLYIDDSETETDWAAGAASRWWLHQSLAALGREIASRGASLALRRGVALDALRAVSAETGATAVFWNRLYEPGAIARDKAIKTALQDDGVAVHSHNGALLQEPWEVMTKTGTPYRVFTPYWRAARAQLHRPDPLAAPATIAGAEIESLPLDALGLEPSIDWDDGLEAAWTPGEAGAMSRARAFVADPVRDYDATRDLPGTAGTSRLSPHLHFGEISPRQVWRLVEEAQDPESDGCRVFLTEIGWREFSHYVMFHFPHTTDAPMNERFAAFPWRDDDEAAGDIRAWERGNTGIPIVDAGMRELWRTGWMHNRVRMIVASLLVKNIRAHWLHGARWFWDTLVDADLPANTMGWQWSAGTGADAAPYFRIFNPVTQGEKFDRDGDYVRHWVPELARLPKKYLHKPWEAPEAVLREAGVTLGRDYPRPIVDLKASRKAALDAFQSLKEAS
ncbi:MAG: deoxyribodipyrimidine photo-lyase [Pseudomonadota bacterium]